MPRTLVFLAAILLAAPVAAGPPTREEAVTALRKAAGFFCEHCAKHGGYVWRYSRDLQLSEGEAETGPATIWVQPPGTPAVGLALLEAHAATGDEYYLRAARAAGEALVRGQMLSGGWFYHVEFDPERKAEYAYRENPARQKKKVRKTTLDDNTTQSATRFLVRLDQRLGFADARVHEAAEYALEALLKAQHPNGAWYQNWDDPPAGFSEADYPVVAASYPREWSRVWQNDWTGRYYLNDNVQGDMIEMLLEAAETYGDRRYRDAALRAGDFLVLAQMPEPQPAWAQQYDVAMHPVWDRKFEPPAISGLESQGAVRSLMLLYRQTGDRKFLQPIPPALGWLRKSLLPDGRLARFYELQTNRPLYFQVRDGRYELTYQADDLPTHYGFIVDSDLEQLEEESRALAEKGPEGAPQPSPAWAELAEQARRAIDSLDERGAWVDRRSMKGFRKASPDGVIQSETFIRNVETLCRFLTAARE